MKKIVKHAVAMVLLMPLVSVAEQYEPAMFDFTGKQLVKALSDASAIDMKSSSAVLYCQSDIDTQGVAHHISCFDEAGNTELVSQTQNAIQKLRFSVAKVDDKTVPVRMSYRVAFSKAGDALKVVLVPNLGSMQEQYGRDYIAPQERLDVSDWYAFYSKNSWVNGKAFLGEGTLSRVAATVDEKGNADTVRTLEADRAYKRDAAIVKNAVKKSRFIPGFVNGKPVPMGYLAVVNYQNDGSAVTSR